jgi:hypothetical protein
MTAKLMGAYSHGPRDAAYDNLGQVLHGHPCPWIECLCGWDSPRACKTWEEVGQQFDKHLEEALCLTK